MAKTVGSMSPKGVRSKGGGSIRLSTSEMKVPTAEEQLDIDNVLNVQGLGNEEQNKVRNFTKKYSKNQTANDASKKRLLNFAEGSLGYDGEQLEKLAADIGFIGEAKGKKYGDKDQGQRSEGFFGAVASWARQMADRLTGGEKKKDDEAIRQRMADLLGSPSTENPKPQKDKESVLKEAGQQQDKIKAAMSRAKRAKTVFEPDQRVGDMLASGQSETTANIDAVKQSHGLDTDVPETTKTLFEDQPATERIYRIVHQGGMSEEEQARSMSNMLGRAAASLWQEPEEIAEEAKTLGIDTNADQDSWFNEYVRLKGEKEYRVMLDIFNKRDDGTGKNLTDNEKVALVAYTSQAYKHINGSALSGTLGVAPEIVTESVLSPEAAKRAIDRIQNSPELKDAAVAAQLVMDAMGKLPKFDGTVERITALRKDISKDYKKGAEFLHSGFTSSSDTNHSDLFEEYDPRSFSSDTDQKDMFHMVFGVKNGVKIGQFGVNAEEGDAFQHEVLLPPGTIVRIEGAMQSPIPHKYGDKIKEFNQIKKVWGRQTKGSGLIQTPKQKAKIEKTKQRDINLDDIIEKMPDRMKKAARDAADI